MKRGVTEKKKEEREGDGEEMEKTNREGVKVGGQQHRGHHKSDFPQSPAEGPFTRPFADTLSGAQHIDCRRHTDADCAGFEGRER